MENTLPSRKRINHHAPFRVADAFFFVTICTANRGGNEMVDHSAEILDAVRHYQVAGKWFVSLCLVMPDHIHMLVHVPSVAVVDDDGERGRLGTSAFDVTLRAAEDARPYHGHGGRHVVGRDVLGAPQCPKLRGLAGTIGDFKSYLSKACGIRFQSNFFDTRIRDDAHYAEKWRYIVKNPVVRGLVATPREWPHSIAFSRQTGEELPHR